MLRWVRLEGLVVTVAVAMGCSTKAGLEGPAGPPGPPGSIGPPGTPADTSQFYTKTQSDGRFLGIVAKADDSNLLDGLDSTAFPRSAAGALEFSGPSPLLPLLTLPGTEDTLEWSCTPGASNLNASFRFQVASGSSRTVLVVDGPGAYAESASYGPGTPLFRTVPLTALGRSFTFHIRSTAAPLFDATVWVIAAGTIGNSCSVRARVLLTPS